MERRELRQRLHLSGMDSRAADMARARGLGFEITEFCWAPRLEQSDAVALVRRQIEGVRHLWLHAPFAELSPCSIDPLVRATALHRFLQTIETAQALGVTRLVVHGGFIPLVYFPEWFVEQSVLFWRELLADVPEGMVLGIFTNETPGGIPGITFVAVMKYDPYTNTLSLTMIDGPNPFEEGATQLQMIRCPDTWPQRVPITAD